MRPQQEVVLARIVQWNKKTETITLNLDKTWPQIAKAVK
jgi:hypothetical protein